MKPDAYKPRAMESNYTDNKDTGNQSHFSKSIILYINNKSRMQPIVGLNTIIECCHNTQPPFYLCKACSVRMTKGGIRSHIMGSFHRFSYIKSQHPDLLSSLKEKTDLTKMAWPLMEIARVLEEKEGVGEVQVLKMGDTLYKEMLFSTFADALSKLLLIQKQQNQHDLQTLVTPEQGLASHVEEPVQMALRDPKQNPRSTERGTHAKMVTQVVSGPQKTGLRSKLIMALRETATRPVIGLRSITECRLFNHPTFYLCAVCSARILKKDILDHIYNSLHRYKYIKFHHAHLLRGFLETAGHKKRVRIINAIAKTVGMEEGMGVVQVIRLRPALYWKMFTHSPVAALSCLQMIQKEWNLKKDITDQRSAIALKHSSPSFSPEPTPKQPCLPNTPDALVPPQKERIQGERVSVPGEARGGASVEVKMVEPMVGLQLVIECRSVEEQQPPYYYLCQACSIKLTGDQQSINKHLSSPQHRYNYINSHRPELLGAKKRTAGLHGTAYILRTMAEELEKEEGSGEIQVIKLSACIYGEVAERNYQWCMKMLKCSENCQTNDKSGEMNIMQHAEARIPLVATKRCTPGLSQQTHGPSAKKERVDAQSASMGCKEPLKDLPIRISHIVGRHAREHFLPDPSPKSYHIPPNSLCDSLTKPSRGPNHCMSHRLPPPKRLSHTLVAPSGPVFNITLPLAKGQLLVQRAPFNTQPSDPDWTLCPETPEVDLDPQFTSHNNGDLTPESPLEDLPPMFPGPSQAYVDSQEALSLCELAQDQSIIVSLEAHRAPTSPSESHLPLPSQAQRECSDPAGRDWLPTGHSVVIDSYEGRLLDLLMEEILEECEVNSEMAERLRLHVHANTPEPGESCRAGVEVQSRSFDSGTHCDSLDPAQGEAVPSGGRCQEDLGYEDPWSYEDRQFAPDPWNLSL